MREPHKQVKISIVRVEIVFNMTLLIAKMTLYVVKVLQNLL